MDLSDCFRAGFPVISSHFPWEWVQSSHMRACPSDGCYHRVWLSGRIYLYRTFSTTSSGMRPFIKSRVKVPHIKSERCQPGLPFREMIMELFIFHQFAGNSWLLVCNSPSASRDDVSGSKGASFTAHCSNSFWNKKGFCVLAIVCS